MIAAICDDDAVFRKSIKNFLIQYKKDRRLHLDIVEFSDGQSLLDYEYAIDIVFLDYEMPGIDGLETAKSLRRRKNLCCIIYITNYSEPMLKAFEVGTYRYIMKPVDFARLSTAIDDYIKDKKMMAPIIVNTHEGQRIISSEDIIYLEAEGKFCNIRTVDTFVRSSKTISKVFEMLPQHCFYRTHKSFAVNLYCIYEIKDNYVILTNDEKASISRTNISGFKNAYREFIKHYTTRMW